MNSHGYDIGPMNHVMYCIVQGCKITFQRDVGQTDRNLIEKAKYYP